MVFVVQYFRHELMVWQSSWDVDVPPSCREVRSKMALHHADKAVILNDDGFELVVEERRKYDA